MGYDDLNKAVTESISDYYYVHNVGVKNVVETICVHPEQYFPQKY